MTKSVRVILLVGLAALTMAACSSSSSPAAKPAATTSASTAPPASTTTTISTAAAGSAYLADVAPANTALTAFSAKAGAWTSSTTTAQAEADAQPAIAALQTLDTALTNAQWPASATADVHTLIGDIGALTGDLQGLSTISLLSDSSWLATLKRDLASLGTAVALVRHDLGLPAAAG